MPQCLLCLLSYWDTANCVLIGLSVWLRLGWKACFHWTVLTLFVLARQNWPDIQQHGEESGVGTEEGGENWVRRRRRRRKQGRGTKDLVGCTHTHTLVPLCEIENWALSLSLFINCTLNHSDRDQTLKPSTVLHCPTAQCNTELHTDTHTHTHSTCFFFICASDQQATSYTRGCRRG